MRSKRGFTLIELLVVIAIIAILAAILFPVFLTARKSAYVSTCTSNMKQFATGINLYRQDNGGYMPQAQNIWVIDYSKAMSGMQYNYFDELYRYTRNYNVAKCPAKAYGKIMDSLVKLWYYDGAAKQRPSLWCGAVYSPSMWQYKQGKMYASMTWSQGGTLVNPDTIDYQTKYNCRSTDAIMLFCMAGTWSITWNDPTIKRDYPDGVAHGSHDHGTPALFADGHVRFVDYTRVGNL